MSQTAIVGTGTWGTAVACLLARNPSAEVILWGRAEDDPEAMQRARCHPHLPGLAIPANVRVTAREADLAAADLVLWAVPTPFTAAMAQRLAPHLGQAPIISLAKGIEQKTLRTPTAILRTALGEGRSYGCLSGPTHAEEVAAGKPTGAVAAGPRDLVDLALARLHGPGLRVYAGDDLLGVELSAALKNVIAVAAGICDGLGLGDNAKATLVTRGLAEMRRLGRVMGAKDATFAGLAGIGDLMTTCYSPHGRNRALGLAVAKGQGAEDFMRECGMVAEGAWTCRAATVLATQHGVELPIAVQVEAVLWQGKSVKAGISDLLNRSARDEAE